MDVATFFFDLAIAAGIGGIIGVEREHRDDNAMVIAGVRTFPLVSIAGLLVAFLERETGAGFLLPVGVAGAFAFTLMFMQMRQSAGMLGLTTPIVMVVTFLLGVFVGYGYWFEAVVVGVLATFLLLTKKRLHRFANYLDDAEILSALQFITVLFILLPVTAALPADLFGFDWLGRGAIVDPYVILLVSVFVSTMSFVSLLAMRKVGPHRGLLLSGLLGGLVNSEATTATLAQRAKLQSALVTGAVVGSLLATTTMLVRNFAIALVADPTFRVAVMLAPFIAPLAVVGIYLSWRRHEALEAEFEPLRVRNPFAVWPALKFALLFAAASIVARLAVGQFGEAGVYVTALGGFVSAGAVIASVASLHAGDALPLAYAVRTSLLAVAASIVGKLVILRFVNMDVYARGRVSYGFFAAAGLAAALASFLLL